MKIRKIFCVGMAVILLCASLPFISAVADENNTSAFDFASDEHMVQAKTENERYALWLDTATANVFLVDKTDGVYWATNPIAPELDNPAAAVVGEEISSQLIISYFDENKVSRTLYSSQCLTENAVDISYADNGFKVIYHFNSPDENFSVTLIYSLKNDFLSVSLPANGIEERGSSHISEVTVLPFLFSGNVSQDGYLIIPDGNGAIMRFNDKNPYAENYSQKVYGNDTAVSKLYDKGNEATVFLPVLGMIRENNGLLAVIEENAAAASVTATPSGKYSDRANAAIKFTLHQTDTAVIPNKDWTYKEYIVTADRRTAYDCKINIYPLSEAGDYCDIAAFYREKLNKEYNRKLLNEAFMGTLQFYGQGWKKSSFMGIPIKQDVTATEFDEVSDILSGLSRSGLKDISASLIAFGSEGYEKRSSDRFKPESSLGGKKAFNSLMERNGKNFDIYWIQDVVCQYNTGIFVKSRCVKGLNHVSIQGGHYLPSTYALEEGGRYWWYVRPDIILKNIRTLNKSLKPSCGIGFAYIGNTLYSDYDDKKYTERQASVKIINEALEIPDRNITLSGGNLYAALKATLLTDLYAKNSLADCLSESIPFYSMVFSGYVNMSSEPFNTNTDWNEYLLDCVEFGLAPNFQITSANNRKLRETTLDNLINTCYTDIEKPMYQIFNQYREISDTIQKSSMIYHSRENGLVRLKYSNGSEILINRSDSEIKTDYCELKAGEWYIKK